MEDMHGMSTEEFRKAGYALIDWICDYREKVKDLPVRSLVKPVGISNLLHSTRHESLMNISYLHVSEGI